MLRSFKKNRQNAGFAVDKDGKGWKNTSRHGKPCNREVDVEEVDDVGRYAGDGAVGRRPSYGAD
jgi:hypothetical protein